MKEATGMTNLVACHVDHCQGAQAVCVKFATGFSFSYSGDCRPSRQFVRIGRNSTVLVHEATFDDDMQGDAEAKKHSTMTEAVGVASAMRAKRLVLTHFSQRYQKIPQLGALEDVKVKLCDPKSADNGSVDADESAVSGTTEAERHFHQRASTPPLTETDLSVLTPTAQRSSSPVSPSDSPTLSPVNNEELKIAIGFDFLRVRVGDIAYVEKFTPTVQHLFETLEKEEKNKAQENPGQVARKLKDELKKQKREGIEKGIQERKEAKERNKEACERTKGRGKPGKSDRQVNDRKETGRIGNLAAGREGTPKSGGSSDEQTLPDVRQLEPKTS
ncbi:MAG: hypothetical protein Q9222_003590 [Ikaeria aurantiellina]